MLAGADHIMSIWDGDRFGRTTWLCIATAIATQLHALILGQASIGSCFDLVILSCHLIQTQSEGLITDNSLQRSTMLTDFILCYKSTRWAGTARGADSAA